MASLVALNFKPMKQSIYIVLLTAISILTGCTDIDKENPYDNQLHALQVTAVYPDGYTEYLREGVAVKIEDVDRGYSYKAKPTRTERQNSHWQKGYIAYKSVTRADRTYSTD